MSLIIDERYLIELQPQLQNFKQLNQHLYNFRCPICGDSKTNKSKTRGYVYANSEENFLRYKCHNCESSMYFRNFIKTINPVLYKKYIIDSMKADGVYKEETKKELDLDFFKTKKDYTPYIEDENLRGLVRLDKCSQFNPCLQYVKNRKIPESLYKYLYYAEDFPRYVNGLIPNKIKTKYRESRLVIPYFDKFGKMYAFQGRSLDPNNKLRYVTIKLDENMPKIYGIDRVDFQKPILCVEGAIDSFFLPNCLAVSGASYDSDYLTRLMCNLTIVPDNERYNKEVCRNIGKAIDLGYRVCLWRQGFPYKDINEAILGGMPLDELLQIIKEDSVQGIVGQVKFKLWKGNQI